MITITMEQLDKITALLLETKTYLDTVDVYEKWDYHTNLSKSIGQLQSELEAIRDVAKQYPTESVMPLTLEYWILYCINHVPYETGHHPGCYETEIIDYLRSNHDRNLTLEEIQITLHQMVINKQIQHAYRDNMKVVYYPIDRVFKSVSGITTQQSTDETQPSSLYYHADNHYVVDSLGNRLGRWFVYDCAERCADILNEETANLRQQLAEAQAKIADLESTLEAGRAWSKQLEQALDKVTSDGS